MKILKDKHMKKFFYFLEKSGIIERVIDSYPVLSQSKETYLKVVRSIVDFNDDKF